MTGYVIYEGPSMLDGQPIVVIALDSSDNSKTGNMVQTYILRQDVAPVEAVRAGADSSICGRCPLRGDLAEGKGRVCYVTVGHGPAAVYKAYKAGRYVVYDTSYCRAAVGHNRMVRLGTYGDPAAVPAWVWRELTFKAVGRTGYTHQWRTCGAEFQELVMASVESLSDAYHAQQLGWRTFRVRLPGDADRVRGIEARCPASDEAGHKLTCLQCGMCDGTGKGKRGSVVINAHGGQAVLANVARRSKVAS